MSKLETVARTAGVGALYGLAIAGLTAFSGMLTMLYRNDTLWYFLRGVLGIVAFGAVVGLGIGLLLVTCDVPVGDPEEGEKQ